MPWLPIKDAANRLNQTTGAIEKRIADGEIRNMKDHGRVLVYVPDDNDRSEGSLEIDSDRIAKAVERIVAAAQAMEDVADACAEKSRFDTGVATTMEGAISHLQSVSKRREFDARIEARRARLAERRARRTLRRVGAVAACVFVILAVWTVSLERRQRNAAQTSRDDMATLAAAIEGHHARLDDDYDALYALMDERCLETSEGVTAAAEQVTRIEAMIEQWSAESDRLQCELDQARAEYEYFGQALGILGEVLKTGDRDRTLQDVLDETWGLKPVAAPLDRESDAERSDGFASR